MISKGEQLDHPDNLDNRIRLHCLVVGGSGMVGGIQKDG